MEAEIARLILVIEQLNDRLARVEARQNPDVRIQNELPLGAQPLTVWIWFDPATPNGEWADARVLVKRGEDREL